uniref:Uncharacterized protein n=1 Tax=Chaetoceros debilis TaxID=122233 RepID=A0A7S3PYI9_9STRA
MDSFIQYSINDGSLSSLVHVSLHSIGQVQERGASVNKPQATRRERMARLLSFLMKGMEWKMTDRAGPMNERTQNKQYHFIGNTSIQGPGGDATCVGQTWNGSWNQKSWLLWPNACAHTCSVVSLVSLA